MYRHQRAIRASPGLLHVRHIPSCGSSFLHDLLCPFADIQPLPNAACAVTALPQPQSWLLTSPASSPASLQPTHEQQHPPRRDQSSARLLLGNHRYLCHIPAWAFQEAPKESGFGLSNVCCTFPPTLCTVWQAAAAVQQDQPLHSPTAMPSPPPVLAQPPQCHPGTVTLSLAAGEGGGTRGTHGEDARPILFHLLGDLLFEAWTRKHNLLATWKPDAGGTCRFAGAQRGTPRRLHPELPLPKGFFAPSSCLCREDTSCTPPASPSALPNQHPPLVAVHPVPGSPELPPTPSVPQDRGGLRRRREKEGARDILRFAGAGRMQPWGALGGTGLTGQWTVCFKSPARRGRSQLSAGNCRFSSVSPSLPVPWSAAARHSSQRRPRSQRRACASCLAPRQAAVQKTSQPLPRSSSLERQRAVLSREPAACREMINGPRAGPRRQPSGRGVLLFAPRASLLIRCRVVWLLIGF